MQPHMILTMPFQTTAGTIRRLRISLPLVPDLVDGRKYFLPATLPAPVGEELRPIARPKIGAPVPKPKPRPGPQRTRTPWWAMGTRKPHDPLADHLARRRISQAQYLAGKEFQKHHAAKDGEPLAGKWLAKCTFELGQDGTDVIRDALIQNMATRQIAEARGKTGPQWERFYFRRLWECLNTLAELYGFMTSDRAVTAAPPISAIHAATAPARGGSA
jgi:hypothetical protein